MTYLQGMAYELARELIGSKIGSLSHEIGVEEGKAKPCYKRICALETRILFLAKEREDLQPEDVEKVRSVIVRYSRTGTVPQGLADSS
jgi:hypothetical protein